MRRWVRAALMIALLPAGLAAQQLAPPSSGGIAALERALARLDQNRRVLLIAAHPDDEDTELLTLLSRGFGADAAYLSLTRGEGGQNLIGPELGDQLGLIRTGELLGARATDGARQYFTRAFDFGFTRSLDETWRQWPRDTLVADVLRIVRRFRPQVVLLTFSGTPRDGHGQHQASSVVGRRVFELLRDSAWGPVKLYRIARFDTAGTTLSIANIGVDPLDGRSFYQLAMAARSLHRSQDMGALQRLGPSTLRLQLLATAERRLGGGTRAAASSLFAGADTSLPPGLARYAALIDSARARVTPRAMAAALPWLTAALAELRGHGPAEFRSVKEPLLAEAIATAAGVIVDAVADDGRVVPGQRVRVAASVWSAGGIAATTREVAVAAPAGWRVVRLSTEQQLDGGPGFFTAGRVPVTGFLVDVPADAPATRPYFLARPRAGALYDWSAVPDSLRGEPADPPLLTARFRLTIAGADVELVREVAYRFGDQAVGEIRKPVVVVPAVSGMLTPALSLWPTAGGGRAPAARTLQVELVSGRRDSVRGMVRLVLPEGWTPVAPQPFVLGGEDARRSFAFHVTAPADLRSGTYEIRAAADVEGGGVESAALRVVDYPHIRPLAWVGEAVSQAVAADIAAPRLRAVGYVRGAADLVPEALSAIGVPVALLSPAQLERGDLAAYDVIVIGSRAYETDDALVANNGRLLEWVREGGTLLVQYQQYPFVRGGFAPFPLRIAQPHDRVTDETSPVTVLEPDDPAFGTPNVIGAADWEGWVQERGLYFAREWDAAYRPLLDMADPGGPRLRGGLLAARYGRGLYVYTGLAFFRQLPAGVPGAYRLFLNLLGLRAADAP